MWCAGVKLFRLPEVQAGEFESYSSSNKIQHHCFLVTLCENTACCNPSVSEFRHLNEDFSKRIYFSCVQTEPF